MSKEVSKNMLLNMKLNERVFINEYVSYRRIIGGWEVRESWSDTSHDVTNSFFIPYNSVVDDPIEQSPKMYVIRGNEEAIEAVQFLPDKKSLENLKLMCKDKIKFTDMDTGDICQAEITNDDSTYIVNLHDYVLKVKNEYFPISSVLFNKLYKES